jgi:hypothetical protein
MAARRRRRPSTCNDCWRRSRGRRERPVRRSWRMDGKNLRRRVGRGVEGEALQTLLNDLNTGGYPPVDVDNGSARKPPLPSPRRCGNTTGRLRPPLRQGARRCGAVRAYTQNRSGHAVAVAEHQRSAPATAWRENQNPAGALPRKRCEGSRTPRAPHSFFRRVSGCHPSRGVTDDSRCAQKFMGCKGLSALAGSRAEPWTGFTAPGRSPPAWSPRRTGWT